MTNALAKINTFILSNMAPQYEKHNNAWADWEEYVRTKAELKGVLFVITGVTEGLKINKYVPSYATIIILCTLPHFFTCRMKGTDVIIPEYWYKLLVWCEKGTLQAEYIFSEHENKRKVSTYTIAKAR